MKHLLLAICLLFSLSGVAGNDSSLIVKGDILVAQNIEYDVCLLNEDGSCTSVKQADTRGSFKITLELGREYMISFTDGVHTKTLFVTADAPGLFEVDVDFGTEDSALLVYNFKKRKYQLNLVDANEYAEKWTGSEVIKTGN